MNRHFIEKKKNYILYPLKKIIYYIKKNYNNESILFFAKKWMGHTTRHGPWLGLDLLYVGQKCRASMINQERWSKSHFDSRGCRTGLNRTSIWAFAVQIWRNWSPFSVYFAKKSCPIRILLFFSQRKEGLFYPNRLGLLAGLCAPQRWDLELSNFLYYSRIR